MRTTLERTTFEVEHKPAITVLHLTGDLRLLERSDERQKLLETFRSGIQSDPGEIVVNLKQLTHLDAHGVAAVAQMLDECWQRGIRVQGLLPLGSLGWVFRTARVFDRVLLRDAAIAEPALLTKSRQPHSPVFGDSLTPSLPQQLALN